VRLVAVSSSSTEFCALVHQVSSAQLRRLLNRLRKHFANYKLLKREGGVHALLYETRDDSRAARRVQLGTARLGFRRRQANRTGETIPVALVQSG